jgi:hypothetical protein
MDDFARSAFREREARQILRRRVFYLHVAIWAAVNVFLVIVWMLTGAGYPWFIFPLFGWGIGLAAHAGVAFLLANPEDIVLQREQDRLRSPDS